MKMILFLYCIFVGIIAQENYKHYIYQLKLQPKYHSDDAWTPEAEAVVWQHYVRLRDAMQEGKVIHAGRSLDTTTGFGIVIFKAKSKEQAIKYMQEDPAVVAGIMTATCDEYSLALLRAQDAFVLSPQQHNNMIFKEVLVNAEIEQVWHCWSSTQGMQQFLGAACNIELKIGGRYEIYFAPDAPEGQRGNEGCTVLSYLPHKMLSFEWIAPPQFTEVRKHKTFVVIELEKVARNTTSVRLYHQGWQKGAEWQKAYTYFDSAWGFVLKKLQSSFAKNK